MIAIHHDRLNFWLRLKLLLTPGGTTKVSAPAELQPKPKRRSHRTTAFFEMP
jgi:hypothetical protein